MESFIRFVYVRKSYKGSTFDIASNLQMQCYCVWLKNQHKKTEKTNFIHLSIVL
jgi:hypothetical protein